MCMDIVVLRLVSGRRRFREIRRAWPMESPKRLAWEQDRMEEELNKVKTKNIKLCFCDCRILHDQLI